LIDIYGHYANRGDTVFVESDWHIRENGSVVRLLNHFASTNHCGGLESSEEVLGKASVGWKDFMAAVNRLREVRFDIRTRQTHPIIKGDLVLCTYPFPLLSPRAMVVSKAQPILPRPKELTAIETGESHVVGS
jgi:DNA (cytosine-5)-methyltransferase 1